ncbi:MAG: bifunctional metallophosphatase/5'-nucleotidase [Methylococcaceae bacterium]|nr:bifunctional metallophosphatase/5'-nucleotidase [Methylococcaceae bacterium]
MKRKQIALGLALGLSSMGFVHAAATTVRVIAFNDFHGNLQSPGNFAGAASGGVDYLAGYVNSLKAGFPNHVVVSAGDLTGATPLISGAFHDEGAIETMNRLGLEFNAVGNHEFDYGRDEILRKQNGGCFPGGMVGHDTCLGVASPTPVPVPYPFEGAKFKYLSANVVVDASGKTLFPPYGIKSFATPTGTVRVGFIGMTLKGTPEIVTPTGVAGLSFKDEVQTVNALVPKLRARGVEAIVVLVHQGGFQGSTGPNFINDCSLKSAGVDDPTALQPLRDIVKGLDGAVDLVVSGHTHTGYTCQLPNSKGKLIPVTQGGNYGRVLTNIDLTIDTTTGDVTGSSFHNTIVDRTNAAITPDSTIKAIVDAYSTNISPVANQVVATLLATVPNTELPAQSPATGTTGEKPAGDLIADAMLAATSPAGFGGAKIAFTNSGGVRADYANKATPSTYPYNLTYGDAFTVQPFGNNMVTMTITAQQLKDALEMQFPGSNCLTPSGVNKQIQKRVLQPSNGFSFSWSESGANCAKIRDVTLTSYDALGNMVNTDYIVTNGTVNHPAQTYRVTVNSFMATGGDGFALFNSGIQRLGGAQDIDTTVAYLARFKTPNPNNTGYDPNAAELHKPRIIKLP